MASRKELIIFGAVAVGGAIAGYIYSKETDDPQEAAGEVVEDAEPDEDVPASKLDIVVRSDEDDQEEEEAVKSTGSGSDNDDETSVDSHINKENNEEQKVGNKFKKEEDEENSKAVDEFKKPV